jgi:hypothetical protein
VRARWRMGRLEVVEEVLEGGAVSDIGKRPIVIRFVLELSPCSSASARRFGAIARKPGWSTGFGRAHPNQALELGQVPDAHWIPRTIGLVAGRESSDVRQLPSLAVVNRRAVKLDIL